VVGAAAAGGLLGGAVRATVDDPSSHPENFPTEAAQERERKLLLGIIEKLVKWENSNNEVVLTAAREEIVKSYDGNPPAVLEPFCGMARFRWRRSVWGSRLTRATSTRSRC
jgi:hypothetical protein